MGPRTFLVLAAGAAAAVLPLAHATSTPRSQAHPATAIRRAPPARRVTPGPSATSPRAGRANPFRPPMA